MPQKFGGEKSHIPIFKASTLKKLGYNSQYIIKYIK
jgi:hypothetical protein